MLKGIESSGTPEVLCKNVKNLQHCKSGFTRDKLLASACMVFTISHSTSNFNQLSVKFEPKHN